MTVNDYLATSKLILKFTPKGLKGHLRLLEDEPALLKNVTQLCHIW